MTDQVTETPTTEPVAEPTTEQTPSFKDDPKYQAMSKQLADYQRKDKEREEADAQATREAEEKALKDAGRFDELEAKYKSDMEAVQSKHAREILHSNLKTELIKTGFMNDMFVAGAIQGYDSETHGEVADYVAGLAGDEQNKGFLSSEPSKTVHSAPGKVPSGGGGENWEQVKVELEGPDRQKRIEARAKMKAHREKTGEYPF